MIEPQPPLPGSAHSLLPVPVVPRQQALISTDQDKSSTYQKWFARQTGVSVDEAIALGLAKRTTSYQGRRG